MRTGFIFTVILSFALLPASTYVSQVSADDNLFDDAPPADEFFSDDPAEEAGELFDAEAEDDVPPLIGVPQDFDEEPSFDDEPPTDQQYPNTQRPGFGEIKTQIEQSPGIFNVQELKTKIREEEDEAKRQELADELTKELQKLFDKDFQKRDDELETLEDRVSKLRASLDKRKAARDRIIKNRIESIMLQADGLSLPGENGYSTDSYNFGQTAFNSPPTPSNRFKEIKVVETYPDGSKKVVVRYFETRTEQRQRQVPYTVVVPQVRTRTVNGEEQSYEVNVPEQRTRVETYSFAVPEPRERELIVEKGQVIQQVVNDWAQQQFNEPENQPRSQTPDGSLWRQVPARVQAPPSFPTQAPRFNADVRPTLRTDEPANRRDAN